jgi:hypothetical protein
MGCFAPMFQPFIAIHSLGGECNKTVNLRIKCELLEDIASRLCGFIGEIFLKFGKEIAGASRRDQCRLCRSKNSRLIELENKGFK